MCAARYEVHQSVIINLARWNGSEGGLPLRQMSILHACIHCGAQALTALRCDPQQAVRVPVSGTTFPGTPVIIRWAYWWNNFSAFTLQNSCLHPVRAPAQHQAKPPLAFFHPLSPRLTLESLAFNLHPRATACHDRFPYVHNEWHVSEQ